MLLNKYSEMKRALLILFSLIAALFAGDRILNWADKPLVTKTHFIFEMPSELPEKIAKQFHVPPHVQTEKVYLVGSFNNWGTYGGDEMLRVKENKWEIDIELPVGINYYKFRFIPSNIKDAVYVLIHDLKSKNNVEDGRGEWYGFNSVKRTYISHGMFRILRLIWKWTILFLLIILLLIIIARWESEGFFSLFVSTLWKILENRYLQVILIALQLTLAVINYLFNLNGDAIGHQLYTNIPVYLRDIIAVLSDNLVALIMVGVSFLLLISSTGRRKLLYIFFFIFWTLTFFTSQQTPFWDSGFRMVIDKVLMIVILALIYIKYGEWISVHVEKRPYLVASVSLGALFLNYILIVESLSTIWPKYYFSLETFQKVAEYYFNRIINIVPYYDDSNSQYYFNPNSPYVKFLRGISWILSGFFIIPILKFAGMKSGLNKYLRLKTLLLIAFCSVAIFVFSAPLRRELADTMINHHVRFQDIKFRAMIELMYYQQFQPVYQPKYSNRLYLNSTNQIIHNENRSGSDFVQKNAAFIKKRISEEEKRNFAVVKRVIGKKVTDPKTNRTYQPLTYQTLITAGLNLEDNINGDLYPWYWSKPKKIRDLLLTRYNPYNPFDERFIATSYRDNVEQYLKVKLDDVYFIIAPNHEQIDAIRTANPLVLGMKNFLWTISLLIALLLMALIFWFLKPIRALTQATSAVAAGDLETQVLVDRSDEIGQLFKSFNEMVYGLKMKEFIKSTFDRYVSHAVAEKILENPESVRPVSEKRNISVMFADIRGFTNYAESHTPEKVSGTLNEFFETMVETAFEFEGTVDKFIGDCIMIVFGAPLDQADHPERAVRCALAMKNALVQLNGVRTERGEEPVNIGIGINSGEAMVGSVGATRRLEFSVIGDCVNLASRLEDLAIEGQILIGPQTYEKVKGIVEVKALPPHPIKGKSAPVELYEVVALK